MHQLIQLDQDLMLTLNGSNSLYMDAVMKTISTTWVWIPLALWLIIILFKNNSFRNFLLIVLMLALTIFLCDRISSGVIKPWVARFRPCQDPTILDQIDIVNGARSGKYGFFSSHAANTFGVFLFIALLVKQKTLGFSLFIWAAIDSYSRIYLGVHYPGDILCGALFGLTVAAVVYALYALLHKYIDNSPVQITKKFTPSGYLVEDLHMVNLMIYITFIFILFYAFYFIQVNFYR